MNIKVNGQDYEVSSDSSHTLLDVLRYEVGLTGAQEGCSTGSCGACTVLLDGHPVNSCLILIPEVEGREITTIEELGQNGELHPLQQAFINDGAVQCGFCTPGMILAAKSLLGENPQPTEADVRGAIAGNLCRCTGYDKIVRAIMSVAGKGGS